MLGLSTLKKRLLRWLVVFASTLGLAIALAQTLNTPARQISNTMPPVPTLIALSSLQSQSKYDRTLAHYATVSRSDGSFRRVFIEAKAIAAIQPEKPLPNGTLIVMKTWYSPENLGTVFVKQKQGEEWQYGSFNPAQPNYQLSFSGSCHSCHAPFPETDFTLTQPLLQAAVQTCQVQTAYCDRPGRTPCEPNAHHPHPS